jgi:hypothetical protein
LDGAAPDEGVIMATLHGKPSDHPHRVRVGLNVTLLRRVMRPFIHCILFATIALSAAHCEGAHADLSVDSGPDVPQTMSSSSGGGDDGAVSTDDGASGDSTTSEGGGSAEGGDAASTAEGGDGEADGAGSHDAGTG